MATDGSAAGVPFDAAATLAAVRARDLNREGIPMFLELGGATPAPAGDPRRRTGRRLAERLITIHAALVRERRDSRLEGPPVREGEAAAVVEGVTAELADELEAEAEEVVPEEERLVAEAVSVLAHHELGPDAADAGPGADGGAGADAPVALDPGDNATLARVVVALCEGRFLTVVNYHNTPAPMAASLTAELRRFARTHAPVTTGDLARLISGGVWNDPRPPLIPVFYEGYRNNHDIAAPACAAAGLVGWFFLITGFLDAPVAEQRAFAEAHDIGLAHEEHGGARLAMSWEEAQALAERHVVTSHSAHHVTAASVAGDAAVRTELEQPSEALRRITGQPSVAHAWLYGSGLAPDCLHVDTLRRLGYRWVFSNLAIDDVATFADRRS